MSLVKISLTARLSLLLVFLLAFTTSNGKIRDNFFKNNTTYFQLGLRLIEDRSFNPEYDFANFGMHKYGYHTMNGSWRPSIAIEIKDSFATRRVHLNWDNAVGFQWAEQDYWGRYPKENIDTSGGGPVIRSEQHHSLVQKYYFYFRTK